LIILDSLEAEKENEPFRVRRSKRIKKKTTASSTQTEWTSEEPDATPLHAGARVLTPHKRRSASRSVESKSKRSASKREKKTPGKMKSNKEAFDAVKMKDQSSRSQNKKGKSSTKTQDNSVAQEPVDKVFSTTTFGKVPTHKLAQGRDAVVYASVSGVEPKLVFKAFRSANKAANEEKFQRRAAAEGIAPQVYEVIRSKGQAVVVMQWIDGISLPSFCKKRSSRASNAMEQSMTAVFDALEKLKFTPNDNNPNNYMVDSNNEKIWRIDFSASKDLKKGDLSVWDPSNLALMLKSSFIKVFPQFTLKVYQRCPNIPPTMMISSRHNQQLAKDALN